MFGASLLEIHKASKLAAVAGAMQLRLSFNCDLNGAFAHMRGCESNILTCRRARLIDPAMISLYDGEQHDNNINN